MPTEVLLSRRSLLLVVALSRRSVPPLMLLL